MVNHPNRSKRARSKVLKVCAYCGGANVSIDATAVWNSNGQYWKAVGFDETNAYCDDCGGETSVEDVEVSA